MPTLTTIKKQQLIQRINNLPINTILPYFLSGEISFNDVPNISAERREYIQNKLDSMPNSDEQREWGEISSLLPKSSKELRSKLYNYINGWDKSRPEGNHVDEAKVLLDKVKKDLEEAEREEEYRCWEGIDLSSWQAILNFLKKYPNTAHRAEIDDKVWSLIDRSRISDLTEYVNTLPDGTHAKDAKEIIKSIIDWKKLDRSDIVKVFDYLKAYERISPFADDAASLLDKLKVEEINRIKKDQEYTVDRLLKLLDWQILTESELIDNATIDGAILDKLRDPNREDRLPDIHAAISKSKPECNDGCTDVFFFGVPSTGKTCVLMGLSNSSLIDVDLTSGGGRYASALQEYTKEGVTVPRTPGSFVTTLKATISSNEKTKHEVNLVEMSGEEFAFKIVNNENDEFSFENMGTGTTELLNNNNRKVFFLIIDPTASVVKINRDVQNGYDEDTGKPIMILHTDTANQRTIIKKMIDIFRKPENAEIMKKVDSIHIIMTKADVLGDRKDRESEAYKKYNERFGDYINKPLIELCEKYNINSNVKEKYHPKLYTFSLGTFYIGGFYKYDETDSDTLAIAICNSTVGTKEVTFWDKVRSRLNGQSND